MDALQILNGYYDAFINLESQRDFFVGFADYFDYANTVPEIVKVGDEIRAEKKPLEDKKEAAMAALSKKMITVKAELTAYIFEKGIKDEKLDRLFRDYDAWLNKLIIGSTSPTIGACDQLHSVIMHLYNLPEHKSFAEKFTERSPHEQVYFDYYPFKEYTELKEIEHEEYIGLDTTRWGQLEKLSNLYEAMKRGKEEYKKLVEEQRKNNTSEGLWAIMNLGVVAGEWVMLEEGHPHDPPFFFNITTVKPWIVRLHNHINARYATIRNESQKTLAAAEGANFDAESGTLHVKGKPIKFRKFTEQYHTLCFVFSKPQKDWFFSELAESIDRAKGYTDKDFHNYLSAIKRRVAAEAGIKDLFITTTQSVKINPIYLN